MGKKIVFSSGVFLALLLLVTGSVYSRAMVNLDDFKGFSNNMAAFSPAHCVAAHRVGKIVLAINNNGTFGTGFTAASGSDCFTGEYVPSCIYPKGTNVEYLFAGALWIGAVVGRDTLVSVSADGWSFVREMFPDEPPFGDMIKRSIIDTDPYYDPNAVSEEDYISVFTDTITEGVETDPFVGRPHKPLYIEVTQNTYAWSYSYAEDFVLFDYRIKNIGYRRLENVYMGIYVDADVCYDCSGTLGFTDDICGFKQTLERTYGTCTYEDTVNIAWIADNDGDLTKEPFQRAPHVTATSILRTPQRDLNVSFNWWISNRDSRLDFGPRQKPCSEDTCFVTPQGDTLCYWKVGDSLLPCPEFKQEFRDFGLGGALGTPEGDYNKYYVLRNREFDYDQVYTCVIPQNDELWMYPLTNPDACDFADGFDTRYLLSFGPFDIDPGQKLPISLAYVAGENFHTDPANISNLPDDPDEFMKGLNFDDLGTNAMWASWIYDNPGVDTDGDGYAGEFRECIRNLVIDTIVTDSGGGSKYGVGSMVAGDTIFDTVLIVKDTFWYKGDGVPDFKGASPPPAPVFWIEPFVGGLRIRFNGTLSETTRDVFSGLVDFEGYRIYISRDKQASGFSVVASYDREDYNKYVLDTSTNRWRLDGPPYTLEELQSLYGTPFGNPDFDPLAYSETSPFVHPRFPDSLFYFEPQDFNQSELGLPGGIRKLYPDQPYPSSVNPDSARPDELTEDGYLKYFEYEYVIEDLLPTVSYWVNVTTFDFGSPESGLQALETSKTLGAKSAYPLASADEVARKNLKVFVYPNPYRVDAGYRALGYEGRNLSLARPDDRVRAIHFANLPPKCTIRIYSLDGDLVREIIHDKDPSDPNASHEIWDLITRNTQLVVSGLYYWTVESENGDIQIGKLVIIM
jgi:hypothetical protein